MTSWFMNQFKRIRDDETGTLEGMLALGIVMVLLLTALLTATSNGLMARVELQDDCDGAALAVSAINQVGLKGYTLISPDDYDAGSDMALITNDIATGVPVSDKAYAVAHQYIQSQTTLQNRVPASETELIIENAESLYGGVVHVVCSRQAYIPFADFFYKEGFHITMESYSVPKVSPPR